MSKLSTYIRWPITVDPLALLIWVFPLIIGRGRVTTVVLRALTVVKFTIHMKQRREIK